MAHRRRGVGVGRSSGPNPRFEKKAEEIKAVSMQSAIETVKKLEIQLTEFAKKHRHEIQHDPAFRHQFLQMCAPLGVDPLSTKKSFWGKLLGMGDFYYELAVKVAEVCLASRSRNGGIMSMVEVQQILQHRKTKFSLTGQTTQTYSTQDIQTSISKLSCLGGGFRTLQVGSSIMIVSVPTELDNDHMIILTLTQDLGGTGISLDQVQESTGWNADRAQRSLDLLLTQGMAWLEEYKGEHRYWFPSVWKESMGAR